MLNPLTHQPNGKFAPGNRLGAKPLPSTAMEMREEIAGFMRNPDPLDEYGRTRFVCLLDATYKMALRGHAGFAGILYDHMLGKPPQAVSVSGQVTHIAVTYADTAPQLDAGDVVDVIPQVVDDG